MSYSRSGDQIQHDIYKRILVDSHVVWDNLRESRNTTATKSKEPTQKTAGRNDRNLSHTGVDGSP